MRILKFVYGGKVQGFQLLTSANREKELLPIGTHVVRDSRKLRVLSRSWQAARIEKTDTL